MFQFLFTAFIVFWRLLSAILGSPSPHCNMELLGRLGRGVISSYNFPFNYRHNLSCVYSIYLNIPSDGSRVICFTFQRFLLESSSPFCSFDYLEIGVNPSIKYCGSGVWQYGRIDHGNPNSNIWSQQFCWTVKKGNAFRLKFSSDNNINGSGFYATYNIFDTLSTSSTIFEVPCRQDEWTCFNRKCVTLRQLCNGQDDCGDGSDESYAHARCRGQNVFACDFSNDGMIADGYCEFTHEGWFRTKTSHSRYGPNGDHTNGTDGFYIYTDVNQTALLLSPELTMTFDARFCLTFWYFTYGSPALVDLKVYVGREQAYSRPEWSRNEPVIGEWTQAEVTIFRQHLPMQVIFAAEMENVFSGIALDDISVIQGSCFGVDASCNFESTTCEWQIVDEIRHEKGILNSSVKFRIMNRLISQFGPPWDHSSTDGGGSYLFVNSSIKSLQPFDRSILVSPPVSMAPMDKKCLRFSYYMHGTSERCCQLNVRQHLTDNTLTDQVWSRSADQRDTWVDVYVALESHGPYQIVVEANVMSGTKSEISIDGILLEHEECREHGKSRPCHHVGDYRCHDGTCINGDLLCDGISQCRDESDEAECDNIIVPRLNTISLSSEDGCNSSVQYRCRNSGLCIPRSWLCDSHNDCEDRSDENVFAGCQACLSNEILCHSGECIERIKKCDRRKDCKDGSDELTCLVSSFTTPSSVVTIECQSHSFQCFVENRCLPEDFLCNGIVDCRDGSDEEKNVCSGVVSVEWRHLVGIGVACVVCLIIVVFFVVFSINKRRRKNRETLQSSSEISTICRGSTSVNSMQRHLHVMTTTVQHDIREPPPYGRALNQHQHTAEGEDEEGGERDPPPPYDIVTKVNDNCHETTELVNDKTTSNEEMKRRPSYYSSSSSVTSSRMHPCSSSSRHQQQQQQLLLPPSFAAEEQRKNVNRLPLGYRSDRYYGDNDEHIYEDPLTLRFLRNSTDDDRESENVTKFLRNPNCWIVSRDNHHRPRVPDDATPPVSLSFSQRKPDDLFSDGRCHISPIIPTPVESRRRSSGHFVVHPKSTTPHVFSRLDDFSEAPTATAAATLPSKRLNRVRLGTAALHSRQPENNVQHQTRQRPDNQ